MKTACLLALCAVLQGCCSTPSHERFVKLMDAEIGKTFNELDTQFASSREQDIKRYERYFDKIDYHGMKVYAPRGGAVSA